MTIQNIIDRENKEDKEILKNKISSIKNLFILAISSGGLIGTLLFVGRNLL